MQHCVHTQECSSTLAAFSNAKFNKPNFIPCKYSLFCSGFECHFIIMKRLFYAHHIESNAEFNSMRCNTIIYICYLWMAWKWKWWHFFLYKERVMVKYKILLTYSSLVYFERAATNITHLNELQPSEFDELFFGRREFAKCAHNTTEWIEASSNLHDHFVCTTKMCPMSNFCCLIGYEFCNWLPSLALACYSAINYNCWNLRCFAN